MTFRRTLLIATSLIAVVAATPALAQQQVANSDPWAQATSDVPVDSTVRFGTLPNGMQYAVMRNATPPGQASFRLRIDAGSLMENDNQLGLAHFMEHMAFNGTTNIPENELLRILERHGLAFGADTNASTGLDATTYMLELPRADPQIVDDALRIMREQVSEALMAADAVDAERGVIEGEQRTRNTPGLRSIKAQLALLAPGQLVSRRLPGGDLTIIRTAPRDRFVEFYEAYYRPERATFVAVGDFDVDEMEAKIRAAFGSWQPKAPNGPDPDLGTVQPRQPETRILVEPGIQSNIQLNWIRNPDLAPDSIAVRRADLVRSLGMAVLNRRLGEISRQDNPPFISASGGVSDLFDSLEVATVSASFNPGEWQRALAAVDQEQRRLLQYGVTDAELAREVANYRTSLENAVAGAATRRTPSLANGLTFAANGREVFSAPATDLALFNDTVSGLTAAQVNAAVVEGFQGQGPLTLLISPVDIEGGEAAVTAALEASRQVPVSAPVAQAEQSWPYTQFGQSGSVVEQRPIVDLGATVVTFANGVRLTVKPTDFRDEQILINVRTGIGEQGLPRDRVTPIFFAGQTFAAGGLGQLTADEMSRVLTGRVYGGRLSVDDDAYVLSGSTRPQDLNLQMQVLAAYLTDPGLRPAPLQQIKGAFPQMIEQIRATPGGAFATGAPVLLANGDQRDALPSPTDVAGWTNDQLAQQVRDGLSSGPIDIIVVGDVTLADAIAAVEPTFGALARRAPAPAVPAGANQRQFPAANMTPVTLTHTGPAEQAMGFIAWPTTDQISDRTEARRVQLLTAVVRLRVLEEIRERLAIAYSPNASASSSDIFPGYGYVSIAGETAPEKLGDFYTAAEAIAASLRDAPPSEDELNRARLPMIESIRRARAGNEFWLGALDKVAVDPNEVEQINSQISDLEAVTPADIQALAQRYLRADTAWRLQVLSAQAGQ